VVLGAAAKRARAAGLSVVLVTLTLRHHAGDPLADLVEVLNGAWTATKSGKAWRSARERFGVVHVVTALEVRYSARTGWHAHKHAILVTGHTPTAEEVEELRGWLAERFGRYVAARGGYVSPTFGVHVKGAGDRVSDADLAEYLAKWSPADELTGGAVKLAEGSITPWELLALAGKGDRRARLAWGEYAAAMPGRRQLTGLGGFAELVGTTEEELEAGAQAEESAATAPLMTLTRQQWRAVVKCGKRGELLALVEATQSAEAVWSYLVFVVGVPRGGGGGGGPGGGAGAGGERC